MFLSRNTVLFALNTKFAHFTAKEVLASHVVSAFALSFANSMTDLPETSFRLEQRLAKRRISPLFRLFNLLQEPLLASSITIFCRSAPFSTR
jgi:hypothetical protein